ncbi:MAG: ABC transporter ATP-binding protein [Canibacter sp.]
MPNIELTHINKKYGRGLPDAVRDLDLTIEDGEFMCLLGPSGCGKTTTLRMISGLEQPTKGKIQVGSKVFDSAEEGIFLPSEKRDLGLVFQSYALWPHLTIEENVSFGLRLRKVPREQRQQRVKEIMTKLDINRFSSRFPSELSGGQQQRVALARMLAVNPKVLLFDEPLSNLDSRLRLEMRAELKRIHAEFNSTIVFVTHDQWEAMTLATKIAVMSEGELQQLGTPDEIYSKPANRFVAEFVGNPPINICELDTEKSNTLRSTLARYLSMHEVDLPSGSIGIRPEAIQTVSEAAEGQNPNDLRIEAEVTGILPTGGSWIIELTVDDTKLFSVTTHRPRFLHGQRINTLIAHEDVLLFNREGDREEFSASSILKLQHS